VATNTAALERGTVVRQFLWPLRAAFWIVAISAGVWVYTVVIHGFWAYREAEGPPEQLHAQMRNYAEDSLQRDIDVLGGLRPEVIEPVRVARWIGDTLRDGLAGAVFGAVRVLMNLPAAMRQHQASQRLRDDADPGGDYVQRALSDGGDGWTLLLHGTYMFATRTAMMTAAVPLWLLLCTTGAIDGLAARERRKACAGRESASLYHRAKIGITFVIVIGYLVVLGLPDATVAMQLVISMAAVCAALVRLQTTFYKKYL
jgi:hypothetical protein